MQACLSLHLSKCHIVENHMSRLIGVESWRSILNKSEKATPELFAIYIQNNVCKLK